MAENGAQQQVAPAGEGEVDLRIHPSGIVPQLQVRRRAGGRFRSAGALNCTLLLPTKSVCGCRRLRGK